MPTRYYKQFLPNVFDHITFTVFSPMGHCDRHVSGKKKKKHISNGLNSFVLI